MAGERTAEKRNPDGPWWLQHAISGTFAIFGGGVMVDALITKWWPGLAAGTAVLLAFGRAAAGARRTTTSAGPTGIRETTEYALEASTAEPKPEQPGPHPSLGPWLPRALSEDTEPAGD